MSESMIQIKGVAKTKRALAKLEQYTSREGGALRSITKGILLMHRFATMAVHVRSGRLKNSLFTDVSLRGNDLVGSLLAGVDYADYEFRRPGFGNWPTPHNTLIYTHAQTGAAVSDMFENDLELAIRSSVQ